MNIGLITYDEYAHAGGYYNFKDNTTMFLHNGTSFWTMTPSGSKLDTPYIWTVNYQTGSFKAYYDYNTLRMRAVINLKADTRVIGLGTSGNPWEVVYE